MCLNSPNLDFGQSDQFYSGYDNILIGQDNDQQDQLDDDGLVTKFVKELNLDLSDIDSQKGAEKKISKKTVSKQKINEQTSENQELSQLDRVKLGLKACKGKEGIFNPIQAFSCLNNLQKQEDPRAYEPEVVK